MNLLKKTSITITLSLLAFGIFTSKLAQAESNPFSATEIVTVVDDHADGKCGEGKCGESKSAKKSKCGEGKCGESK